MDLADEFSQLQVINEVTIHYEKITCYIILQQTHNIMYM